MTEERGPRLGRGEGAALLFRLPRFEARGHRGTTVVCSRPTLIGSEGSIPAAPAVPAPHAEGLSDEQDLEGVRSQQVGRDLVKRAAR